MMRLADAEQVHNVTIKVVQNLDRRWLLMKQNLCTSGERLHVRRMFRKELDDFLCKTVLSADIWEGANHVMERQTVFVNSLNLDLD